MLHRLQSFLEQTTRKILARSTILQGYVSLWPWWHVRLRAACSTAFRSTTEEK